MRNYEMAFLCTLHNVHYAFDRHHSVDPALLRCPVCAHEREVKKDAAMKELREHRDLLLKAIDLKRLVQAE
jgi:hypothetical protein